MRYKIKIKSITPLLMNKFSEEISVVEKRGEVRDSPELAHKRVYKNEKGEIVVPSEWLIRAMEKIAGEIKLPGSKKQTVKSLLSGNIIITPEYIVLNPQKYTIDARSVVIPATGGRIIRYRPRFDNWSLEFEITVLDKRITEEILQHLLTEAGRRVGIGDGRSIGFGRFIVEEFKKL